MLLRITVFFSICFLLASCAINNQDHNREPIFNREDSFFPHVEINEKPREYKSISIFQPLYAIKNGDTTNISELICFDSLLFTQAFSEIEVSQMCNEFGIQGNTYYSTYTNKYGGFEDVRVVRSLDNCFKETEKEMILKVSEMRILQEVYFNSEIVFYHKYRLE